MDSRFSGRAVPVRKVPGRGAVALFYMHGVHRVVGAGCSLRQTVDPADISGSRTLCRNAGPQGRAVLQGCSRQAHSYDAAGVERAASRGLGRYRARAKTAFHLAPTGG